MTFRTSATDTSNRSIATGCAVVATMRGASIMDQRPGATMPK